VDASAAASSLIGSRIAGETIEEAAAAVQQMIAPSGNVHANADYQRHVAGVLTERALRTAYQRIGNAA
jgi:carbon-monoxide dehydrogenase medium subunit